MRIRKPVAVVLIVIALLLVTYSPVAADAMTLGVYFCGKLPASDGGETVVTLDGVFTVTRNGVLLGEIKPGETMPITGDGRIMIEPRPETVDPAWDLSDAVVEVNTLNGMHLTVPIVVNLRTENIPDKKKENANNPVDNTEKGSQTISENETVPTPPPATIVPSEMIPTALPEVTYTAEPAIDNVSGDASVAVVTVLVFLDKNNNSEQGLNEPEVSGVTVYLTDEKGTPVSGVETGENGTALLYAPAAGRYRVKAFLPDNLIFSKKGKSYALNVSCMDIHNSGEQESDLFQISDGDRLELGIGVQEGIVVSGVCWFDTNGDGIMTEDEPKMPGVRITMSGQKNGLEFATVSGENGEWSIARVRPGFYDLTAYTPEGYMFTKYSKDGGKNRSIFTNEGSTKQTKTLDTNEGGDFPNQNIGFIASGSVSGMCFLDANYNGLYDDGEPPLSGVKVTAIKQLKDEEIAVTYSGEDGKFILNGLRGNTYRIRAVLPNDGSVFTVVSDDPLGNHFVPRAGRREYYINDFILEDGEQRIVNVGAIYYATISGTVYLDDDFSGNRSDKEKTVQGIPVKLLDADGNQIANRITNAKGHYQFEELVPGRYSLLMTAKQGYAFTLPGTGSVILNLNNGEGYSEPFDVPLGSTLNDKDAGMIKPSTVKGFVFADKNDNGIRDNEEKGLVGTKVSLMDENGEVFSQVIRDDGEFLFDAVMPGRYYLYYELPENGVFTENNKDGNRLSGENGAAASEWFDLGTDDLYDAPLCGGIVLGGMNGVVFRDHDALGIMGENDETLSGVRIVLTPQRADLEKIEVVTDSDGLWSLDGLRPDAWTLMFELPDSYVTSRMPEVTLPLTSGMKTQTVTLNLEMGKRWSDQKIGVVIPAKLSGSVWLDENNNGVQDEDEQTPEGVIVRIVDEYDGSDFASVKTDSHGVFRCDGMIPGDFRLESDLPANSDATIPGDCTFAKESNRMIMKGVHLGEGDENNAPRLGYIEYTAIEGSVWIDRSGIIEMLEDVRVALVRENEEIVKETITGETGEYRFQGLLPGLYRIQVSLPEGCLVAEPDDERLNDALISVIRNTDGREGSTEQFELKMGKNRLNMDIGSVLPGTIGDWCWLDENGNGWQDGGEYGIPGVRIELQRNGITVAETVSEKDGYYWFREVYPAVYTLKVTPPEEVKPTQKRTDIYLIVSSLTETEDAVCYTGPIAVQSDKTDFNVDMGFVCRKPGVYPPGLGEGRKMDWSIEYTPKE